MNGQLTDQQLLEYSREGLIPGPGEGESDFLRRVNFCLELDRTLGQCLEKEVCLFNERGMLPESLRKSLRGGFWH